MSDIRFDNWPGLKQWNIYVVFDSRVKLVNFSLLFYTFFTVKPLQEKQQQYHRQMCSSEINYFAQKFATKQQIK